MVARLDLLPEARRTGRPQALAPFPQLPQRLRPEVLFAFKRDGIGESDDFGVKRPIVHGDQHDGYFVVAFDDLSRGRDPSDPWHRYIHQHELWRKKVNRSGRFLPGTRLADKLESRSCGDQISQHVAKGLVVVDREDRDVPGASRSRGNRLPVGFHAAASPTPRGSRTVGASDDRCPRVFHARCCAHECGQASSPSAGSLVTTGGSTAGSVASRDRASSKRMRRRGLRYGDPPRCTRLAWDACPRHDASVHHCRARWPVRILTPLRGFVGRAAPVT